MQGPDDQIMSWIDDHRVSWITSFTKLLMHAGETLWFLALVGLALAAVVVWKRAWRVGIATAWATLTAGSIADGLKNRFERPRPSFPDALIQVDGFAMPSSHAALLSAGCIALLCVVTWSSRKSFATAAALLGSGFLVIALSMIYLGAHWPTDVLAGMALGGAVGAAFGFVFKPRELSA